VWHIVVEIPSVLASMGHVAITLVYRVARARVCIGWRSATALDNIISFALPFPLTRPLSPFPFPVLVAISVMLALGCSIIADGRTHPLMVMNLVRPPRAGR